MSRQLVTCLLWELMSGKEKNFLESKKKNNCGHNDRNFGRGVRLASEEHLC